MAAILRAAKSVEDFVADSLGASLTLESLVYFRTMANLTGYFLFDDPSPDELAALGRIIASSLALDPHPSLIDGRALRVAPHRYYDFFVRMVPEHSKRFATSVTELAIIGTPRSIAGVVALGFFEEVERPYPVKSFAALEPALEWLGHPDPSATASELEELAAQSRGVPALVVRLRAHIESAIAAPEAEDIAPKLGVSARTLHRRLAELGTTFGEEVMRTRVEIAKHLLRSTDAPISQIAIDVGSASVSSFNVMFKKREGTTPTEFRKAHR